MIGMGGGGEPEDPLLGILRVLGDQDTFQRKYQDLLTQTVAAKQATENAIKERAAADGVIARANADSLVLENARAAFQRDCDVRCAAAASRETNVRARENACADREAALTSREAALAKATVQAKAEHDERSAKLDAKATEHNTLLDRRKTGLDATEIQNQKKLDARAAILAEREDATEQLNRSAAATKADYERKIAALRAAINS